MSYVFPIEPSDGWHCGDLAYCVNDHTHAPTVPRIEKGRVYRVSHAWKPRGMGHHGLKLEGVDTGDADGFWSNKFVKLAPIGGRLKRLSDDAQWTCEHYWARTPPEQTP